MTPCLVFAPTHLGYAFERGTAEVIGTSVRLADLVVSPPVPVKAGGDDMQE